MKLRVSSIAYALLSPFIITTIAFEERKTVIHKPKIAIKSPCLKIIASFNVLIIREATSLGAILVIKSKIGKIKVFLPIQANRDVKKSKKGLKNKNFMVK